MNGAFLIDKPAGISSFGVIDAIQKAWGAQQGKKKKELPKLGHGGTLDPFATGLLIVCVGEGVKLARYFLGSQKEYTGIIRFGESTIPGDPSEEISVRSEELPSSLECVRREARRFTQDPYFQTPPMHSAKKRNGKPLYELARLGIQVEREAKHCFLGCFEILDFEQDRDQKTARSHFRVICSSGTYVRVLAQDLASRLGTVGMLDALRRTGSGIFDLSSALLLSEFLKATDPTGLGCFVPFDQMLRDYPKVIATESEALALRQGRQEVLLELLKRVEDPTDFSRKPPQKTRFAVFSRQHLVAMASLDNHAWRLERVFNESKN